MYNHNPNNTNTSSTNTNISNGYSANINNITYYTIQPHDIS